jgi:hypothetical protein
MKNKDEIINRFNEMIHNAWTWERLTREEKNRWDNLLSYSEIKRSIRGCEKAKWEILNSLWHSYLLALDYCPIGWRE